MGKRARNKSTLSLSQNERAIVALENLVTTGLIGHRFNFASSLLDQYRRTGKLTPKQWFYVRDMAG